MTLEHRLLYFVSRLSAVLDRFKLPWAKKGSAYLLPILAIAVIIMPASTISIDQELSGYKRAVGIDGWAPNIEQLQPLTSNRDEGRSRQPIHDQTECMVIIRYNIF